MNKKHRPVTLSISYFRTIFESCRLEGSGEAVLKLDIVLQILSPARGFVTEPRVERRFLPLNPGIKNCILSTLKGLRNPFGVDRQFILIPRVGRKKLGQPWAVVSAAILEF